MDPDLDLRSVPKQKRSQERMETILDAAAEVFTELGYDKATTNEIAIRANTSIGSVYRVFPGKLSVFRALSARYTDVIDQIVQETVKKAQLGLPTIAVVGEFMDGFETFLKKNPAFEAVFVFADTYPETREVDNLNKAEGAKRMATAIRGLKPTLSQHEAFYIARTLIQITNSYLRMRLTVPDVPRAHARKQYQIALAAYIEAQLL